jgi:hypothetical protein
MDITTGTWYGQLQVGGISKPFNFEGTVTQLSIQMLKQMQQLTPRELANGKSFTMLFSSNPFGDQKATIERNNIALEVESAIELNTHLAPEPTDTYESYFDKLVANGTDFRTAEIVACDWFDRVPNARTGAWLNDPKAAQFRKLNSVQAAFDAALPNEYESLKRYVLAEYPEFCKGITFRTA